MRWLACIALVLHLAAPGGCGQELEPRALTNVPVGTNFVALGYAHASGNILLDPAIPIDDLDSRLHTFVGAYVRAIDVVGLSGKFDLFVPFAAGDWEGVLEGVDTTRSATGFGDPRVRLSVNFIGAPALRATEFAGYTQKTIFGASLQVIAPLGQYDSSKLLNLGSNRWVFRAQAGVSQVLGPWTFEAFAGGWFFTRNADLRRQHAGAEAAVGGQATRHSFVSERLVAGSGRWLRLRRPLDCRRRRARDAHLDLSVRADVRRADRAQPHAQADFGERCESGARSGLRRPGPVLPVSLGWWFVSGLAKLGSDSTVIVAHLER